MFLKFNEEAQKLLVLSLKEKNKLNDEYIGTEHVMLALLSMKNNYICKLLNELGLNYDLFSSKLEKNNISNKDNYYLFTPLVRDIFETLEGKSKKNSDVGVLDIIIEILNRPNSKVIRVLKKLGIDTKDLYKKLNVKSKKKDHKKGILNDIGVNLNNSLSKDVILERESEINNIIEILCCKNKNNPLLIGEAGVGKTAIVEEFARRIKNGKVPHKLRNKKIYSIEMSSLVAGTKYRGEFEEKINKLINEIEGNDDIILFIDEIHTLVGAGGADGAIDASNILKPALARGNIKIIGATTTYEYQKHFASDKALTRRFKTINVKEPTIKQTKNILLGLKPIYEDYHNVIISNSIIDKIIYYSSKYLVNRKFPDKAIDILDEVCVSSSLLFNKKYSLINNIDLEINKVLKEKNKSLIDEDYISAIKYSSEEKKLRIKQSKLEKKFISSNSNVEVDEKTLLKVLERKTNIPFYTYKFNQQDFVKKNKSYRENNILSTEVVDKIISVTEKVFDNMVTSISPIFLNITSFNQSLSKYFIKEYTSNYFNEVNKIEIDISSYRNIDEVLGFLLKQVKDNPFSIVILGNTESDKYNVDSLLNNIKVNNYYIDKENNRIDFSHIIFISSDISCCDGLGFSNNTEVDSNALEIIVDDNLLKRRIKKLVTSNNYKLSNKNINRIVDKIKENYLLLDNLEEIVKKEVLCDNREKIKV